MIIFVMYIFIITAKTIHQDEINHVSALYFAQETGQTLTDFYSEDSPKIKENNIDNSVSRCKVLHVKKISNENANNIMESASIYYR